MKMVVFFQVQKIQTREFRIRPEGQMSSRNISTLTSFLSLILLLSLIFMFSTWLPDLQPSHQCFRHEERKEHRTKEMYAPESLEVSLGLLPSSHRPKYTAWQKEVRNIFFIIIKCLKAGLLTLQVKQNFVTRKKRGYCVGS